MKRKRVSHTGGGAHPQDIIRHAKYIPFAESAYFMFNFHNYSQELKKRWYRLSVNPQAVCCRNYIEPVQKY